MIGRGGIVFCIGGGTQCYVENTPFLRLLDMKAPDKIYLEKSLSNPDKLHSQWYPNDVIGGGIEYIRKDELIEWLLKGIEMSEICHSEYGDACAQAYQAVIDKINSL